MIIGIGIDIVHTSRMRDWQSKVSLLDRFFHPNELAAARARGAGLTQSLAARFAAKEAFGKALGTGFAGLKLRDIEVVNDEFGKPSMVLHTTAKAMFERVGGASLFVSLTHESDNAIAVVVIEGS
jgi:holo-[acyl-carrier protein] synthase